MSSAPRLKDRDQKTRPSAGVALQMLQAIAGGITSATLLAEGLRIPIQSVSRWAKRLQRAGWLRKDGKGYALTPKAKKLTPKSESQTASQSASIKDSQADDPQAGTLPPKLKNSEIPNPIELVKSDFETSSFRITSDAKTKHQLDKQSLFFSSPDWRDYLDLATLPRKAGCSPEDLPRVVYKEATDNACDAGPIILAKSWADSKGNLGLCIKDAGPGLDPGQVPIIYSPNRPQLSSKRIRRISRGILGNGGRVIGGAVAASEGTLIVETRGRRLTLQMDMTTGKMTAGDEQIPHEPGSTLYIALGRALALRKSDFDLARTTILLSRRTARVYSGPSSPWWYGANDLHRLAREAPSTISFSGLCRKCGFSLSGITQPSWRCPANTLSLSEIENALPLLRGRNQMVPAKNLGDLGPGAFTRKAYAKEVGIAPLDGAQLPYVVEAWADCSPPTKKQGANNKFEIELVVNQSMTPAKLYGHWSTQNQLIVRGCDLNYYAPEPIKNGDYAITLSAITPHLPMVNDGKEPSLKHVVNAVLEAICKAAKKASQAIERPAKVEIKEAAWQIMEKAYMSASDNGRLPANARQIMYAARPYILQTTGLDSFGDHYFTQTILPGYLKTHAEQTRNWDVVFDARGNATEPHTGRRIPLGTLAVRRYLEQVHEGALLQDVIDLAPLGLFPTIGPSNRFKNALFIEKEGFDQLLAAARFAQKYDLFIMSTKGLRVIALDMLLDALCRCGLERVFVLHDFDISGFSILGTLGKSSRRYRCKNQIQIIDLGLRLADVRAEQLQTEPI